MHAEVAERSRWEKAKLARDIVAGLDLRPLVLTFLVGIERQTGAALTQYAKSLKYRDAATQLASLVKEALARA